MVIPAWTPRQKEGSPEMIPPARALLSAPCFSSRRHALVGLSQRYCVLSLLSKLTSSVGLRAQVE
jgi:hypothetical protein